MVVSCWVSTSGGSVVANINRWLGQMSASPMTAAEVEALPKIDVLGRPSPMIDVEGTYSGGMGDSGPKENYRMVGVVAQLPATGLFVKMVGPTAAVESQLDAFKQLCGSLQMQGMAPPERPGAAPAGDPHTPGAAPAGAAAETGGAKGKDPQTGVGWTRPDGWTDGARNAMRIATFHLPSSPTALCTVTKFGGSPLDNINRWRGEMQSRPLNAAGLEQLEKITVVGRQAYLLEIEGNYSGGVSGQPIDNAKMFAIVCPLGDGFSIFVKLVGPAAEIGGERDRFINCASRWRAEMTENRSTTACSTCSRASVSAVRCCSSCS